MTTLDGTGLEEEAAIIHWAGSKGITLRDAEDYELWELAAACGVHLTETRAEHDKREIIDRSEAYWEETSDRRSAILSDYAQKRRERKRERKARKVT